MHFKDMTHPTPKSKKNMQTRQTRRLEEIISEYNRAPSALYPKGWANRRSSMIPHILQIYINSRRLRNHPSEN